MYKLYIYVATSYEMCLP